jgi:hypothetical protein
LTFTQLPLSRQCHFFAFLESHLCMRSDIVDTEFWIGMAQRDRLWPSKPVNLMSTGQNAHQVGLTAVIHFRPRFHLHETLTHI